MAKTNYRHLKKKREATKKARNSEKRERRQGKDPVAGMNREQAPESQAKS